MQPSVSIQKIWIHKSEYLKALEVREAQKRRFYSYTYVVRTKGGWTPCVRWDNWERQPHVDRYDENGALVEQRPCGEKELEDVVKLVRIFRRNMSTMDLPML